MNKAYISLNTCASSCAIHLDLEPELSSEAFLQSFKRFVGRRGIPTEVLSDNAKKVQERRSARLHQIYHDKMEI